MRPAYDLVTQAGAWFMEQVLATARAEGYAIDDLERFEATREALQLTLSREGVGAIFYGVGHGSEEVYTGDAGQPVLTVDNAGWMRGRIVHLMSCRTGVALGPALIEAGAQAFIGYTYDYYVLLGADPRVESEYTQAFLDPDVTFARALVEGKSLGEAYRLSRETAEAWIEHYRAGDDPNADVMIWCLLSNLDHFVVLTPAGPITPTKAAPLKALLAVGAVASVALLLAQKHK